MSKLTPKEEKKTFTAWLKDCEADLTEFHKTMWYYRNTKVILYEPYRIIKI